MAHENSEMHTPLHKAASNGDFFVFAALLEAESEHKDARAKDGRTPLHMACEAGHAAVADALVGAGASIEAQDDAGSTPLCIASSCGHKSVAEALVSAGAQVNHKTKDGSMSLFLASRHGHLAVVQLLLVSGANHSQTSNGSSSLLTASSQGHCDVVVALLAAGADPNLMSNADKVLPIHLASARGHVKIVEALLAKGADKAATDVQGRTAMYVWKDGNHSKPLTSCILQGFCNAERPRNRAGCPARCRWRPARSPPA
jgi:ankyrin repeat protein